MKKIGIYVHFPFCNSKCKYCNFNSYPNKNHLQLSYFQSLLKEVRMYSNNKIVVDTIFIGGGTPSVMFDGCISTLISEIKKCFTVDDSAEITIEANPNSITPSKVYEWKSCGINRVSVGLQTINPNLLKLIGRPSTKQNYLRAIEEIRGAGIENINTDCLIGLPKQKLSDVKRTLNLVTKAKVTHVSVYSLILEEGTPLYDMIEKGETKLPKEEKTLGMYDYSYKYLKECGYNRYEVSNFAIEGFECKHNSNTWDMHEYIGIGAGAHGFIESKRYGNVEKIEEYISLIEQKQRPIEFEEKIEDIELFEETIMLGLRTSKGINLKELKEKYDKDLLNAKSQIIKYFKDLNLIEVVGDNLFLTEKGYPVLNKIILDLVS